MAKKFNQWLDEFVEQGADAKDVTNWPENAGGGSTVIANPELVGDEPNLEGLEVDGAKYKVPQGGGGSELYTYYIKAEDPNQDIHTLTFQCDNSELDSYDKLAQYLFSKGYYEHHGDEDDYTPVLVVSSNGRSSGDIINGLYASQEEGRLWIYGSSLCVSSGSLSYYHVYLKSEKFTIILVTK